MIDGITTAPRRLIPVVWALRCRCGAEVQGEHILRSHLTEGRLTDDELREAERIAKRAACLEAERLGWAVAPHGYELDLCPRCRP